MPILTTHPHVDLSLFCYRGDDTGPQVIGEGSNIHRKRSRAPPMSTIAMLVYYVEVFRAVVTRGAALLSPLR